MCKWKSYCESNNFECSSPYCKFSNEKNADKIFDLIDLYVDLKESVMNEIK